MKTKFAIGCLVQWYESEMIQDYVETLKEAIDRYDGEIIIDVGIVMNQDLEKSSLDAENFLKLEEKIKSIFNIENINFKSFHNLYTIADYRREFNDNYCDQVDVLIWGESDMLVPKQMFLVLDMLHENVKDKSPKYVSTFGICKMWDNSWKPIEHVDFTDKPFIEGDSKNWWNIPYTMTKEEMNQFNDKVDELDISIIKPHKFNGCGLVISSEVVRSGVNIPRVSFFINEDTAFLIMLKKILGDVPQYHFRNILLVHNRKHPNKRLHVLNENDNEYLDKNRTKNEWYNISNEMNKKNIYNMFDPSYKSYKWEDVWKNIK